MIQCEHRLLISCDLRVLARLLYVKVAKSFVSSSFSFVTLNDFRQFFCSSGRCSAEYYMLVFFFFLFFS